MKFMEDLKARGIIKDRSPEEQEAYLKKQAEEALDDKPPYLMIIGIVGGILLTMVGLGALVTWLIIRYADVSELMIAGTWLICDSSLIDERTLDWDMR